MRTATAKKGTGRKIITLRKRDARKRLVERAVNAGAVWMKSPDGDLYLRFPSGRDVLPDDLTPEIIHENAEQLPVERAVILVRMTGEDFKRFEQSGTAVEILNPTLIRVECLETRARLDAVITTRSTTKEGLWLSLRRAD